MITWLHMLQNSRSQPGSLRQLGMRNGTPTSPASPKALEGRVLVPGKVQ